MPTAKPEPILEYNAWDKVVSFFSPKTAMRNAWLRARASSVLDKGGGTGGRAHHGASRTRRMLKRWQTTIGSADADQLPEIPLLRERSRDAIRNAPMAEGAVSSVVCSVIGGGIRPRSVPDWRALGITEDAANDWAQEAQRIFKYWASSTSADSTRVQPFDRLSSLAFRSTLENGDIFCRWVMRDRPNWPFESALELIEADRCDNPNQGAHAQKSPIVPENLVWGGVEKTSEGVPVAYWFMREHPGQIHRQDRRFFRVNAFDSNGEDRLVLHLYDRLRVGQSRGLPYLTPVLEALKKLTEYSESEATAALISSFFTVFIHSQTNDGFAELTDPDGTKDEADPGEVNLGQGAIVEIGTDDKVEIADPKRPNSQYEPFMRAQLREIGVGLGLPLDVLSKSFDSSYSAARAALLVAWRFFMDRRSWITGSLHTPAYRRILTEAIAKGMIEAPGFFKDPLIREAWLQVKWIGPAAGQIDPNREIQAALARIDGGISTIADETAALTGGDFNENHPQRIREHTMRADSRLEPGTSGTSLKKPAEQEDAEIRRSGADADAAEAESEAIQEELDMEDPEQPEVEP